MNIENTLSKIENMPFSIDRVVLTENLFHISFWNSMNTNQKVRLLQLLENNTSSIEGREPNQVIVRLKMPYIATASLEYREIRISQWHLENGLSYLKGGNAQFYCAILHEHDHISKFVDSQSDIRNKEIDECRINFANMLPYSDKYISEYIDYRLQPIEYYAHKFSEEKTIETFQRLEKEFGSDIGYRSWYANISLATVDSLISLYNQEYATNYTFEDIYENILTKISQINIHK